MAVNQRELAKLVHFCRKNGVFKCKTADFEIEIARESLRSPKPTGNSSGEITNEPFPPWNTLSPEEQLLWSSPPVGE